MSEQQPDACADELRNRFADMGVEVTITTVAPLVVGPYTTDPMRCPHGVLYWMEPTGEQVAAWARDGVR